MNPDLAITIVFVFEVFLFALAFAVYVVHEAHKAHANVDDPELRPDPLAQAHRRSP
jgi:hypothetical protein